MNPKLISRHIGLITGTGLGAKSAGCHRSAEAAGAGGARIASRPIAHLLDGDAMTHGDPILTRRARA